MKTRSATSKFISPYRCLQYQLIVDCDRLTHDVEAKVVKILDPLGKHTKKHSICFQLCNGCFNETLLELSHIDKSNQHKKLKKLESTFFEQFDPSGVKKPSKTGSGSPQHHHPTAMPFKRRQRNYGSFHTTMPGMDDGAEMMFDNKVLEAARLHGLHKIPVIIEIAKDLEKLKINEPLAIDVLDNVGAVDAVHLQAHCPGV